MDLTNMRMIQEPREVRCKCRHVTSAEPCPILGRCVKRTKIERAKRVGESDADQRLIKTASPQLAQTNNQENVGGAKRSVM